MHTMGFVVILAGALVNVWLGIAAAMILRADLKRRVEVKTLKETA
jgi:hypothetical protein